MGQKIAWIQDKLTTVFGKDSMSSTFILVVFLAYKISEYYGISEEVFFTIVTIVANVYNNLTNQENKELKKTNDSYRQTILIHELGGNPEKPEELFVKNDDLPEAPE